MLFQDYTVSSRASRAKDIVRPVRACCRCNEGRAREGGWSSAQCGDPRCAGRVIGERCCADAAGGGGGHGPSLGESLVTPAAWRGGAMTAVPRVVRWSGNVHEVWWLLVVIKSES